jgi:hypothetical protein
LGVIGDAHRSLISLHPDPFIVFRVFQVIRDVHEGTSKRWRTCQQPERALSIIRKEGSGWVSSAEEDQAPMRRADPSGSKNASGRRADSMPADRVSPQHLFGMYWDSKKRRRESQGRIT